MKRVCVLMSTYNGERYIREQIDSVLRQKGVMVTLLIRDDGSSDKTISIIEEYSHSNTNIDFILGDNVRPAKSFIELIKLAPKAEYYALCDQDDVWEENKLFAAVEKICELNSDKPVLYYSNLKIVDKDLNFYRLSHNSVMYNANKYSALTENLCTGCTAVFNYVVKELIEQKPPAYCTMHDTWIYMMCMLLGEVYYDKNAYIMYRQHDNNVVGTYLKKNRFMSFYEHFIRLFDKELQPRYKNAVSFYESYGNELDEESKDKVLKVVNYKNSLKAKFRLLTDKKIRATTLFGNIRFVCLVLLGRA